MLRFGEESMGIGHVAEGSPARLNATESGGFALRRSDDAKDRMACCFRPERLYRRVRSRVEVGPRDGILFEVSLQNRRALLRAELDEAHRLGAPATRQHHRSAGSAVPH